MTYLSTSFRHFRALSRKNVINWKRTPLGSVTEIICPVILMLILVYARSITKPEFMDGVKISALRHPIFQPAKPDGPNGEFTISLTNVIENALDMNNFMKYSKYTNIKRNFTFAPNVTERFSNQTDLFEIDTYLPVVDPLGPYLFYPPQCYSKQSDIDKGRKYRSPMIAYIKQGNQIEEDLIQQLEAMFSLQRQVGAALTTFAQLNTLSTLLPGLVNLTDLIPAFSSLTGSLGEITESGLLESLDFNSTDSEASLGKQTGFGDLGGFEHLGNFTFRAFDNQTELDEYISHREYGWAADRPGVCFGFQIKENEDKNKYELELHFNDQFIPFYQSIPDQKLPSASPTAIWPDANGYTQYSFSGYAYLQNWVANTILKRKSGNPDAQIMTMTVPTILPRLQLDFFGQIVQQVFTFFVLVMYIPPLYRTVYRIVQEKESRVKESMRMMGLGDLAYWMSWYTYYTTVNFAISFLTWAMLNGLWKVLLYVKNFPDLRVMRNTNDLILWASLFFYGQSLFGYVLITQSLFSRARSAAITTSVVYFGSSILSVLIEDPNSSPLRIFFCTLSPPVTMIKTFYVIGAMEGSNVGINFRNIGTMVGGFSVLYGLRMFLLNSILSYSIGFYFDQAMPKTFGVRKHPCFCFLPSTYRSRQSLRREKMRSSQIKPEDDDQSQHRFIEETMKFETANMSKDCYERVIGDVFLQELKDQAIRIESLKKTYENGFQAVKGINLKLFSDQIFVLLGHNGAGKTSTISMLTGLYPATEGTAEIFGADLNSELDKIRSFMGVCPQHDVLFELLTPEEHLDIFYEFKGGEKQNKKDEIEKLMKDVGVADKRKAMAYQLSGGNKRKLSVAIALCGGSKFVLLDEPTSGLDLSARRELWNMLRGYKRDKVILLTTHYMDEADILGDRIGIMSGGKMTCLGSSMFLKNKFGVGYHAAIEKESNEVNEAVVPYFEKHLGPGVRKFTEVGQEMSITIPTQYAPRFKKFFIKLDNDLKKLGIRSYGVQISTLEQVFLKIGHLTDPEEILSLAVEERKQQENEHRLRRMNSMPVFGDNFQLEIENYQDNKSESGGTFKAASGSSSKGGTFDVILRRSDSNMEFSNQKDNIVGRDSNLRLVLSSQKNKLSQVESSDNEKQAPVQEYSLEQSPTDETFVSNLKAVLTKRLNIYKRNRRSFLFETLIPAILVLLGVIISKLNAQKPSKATTLSPDLLPLKQKILINQSPIDFRNSDISTDVLAANLPMASDAFEVTFDNTKRTREDTYEEFGWNVFEFGQRECSENPYLYASYDVYQASQLQQNYKFVSHVNITSQDIVGIAPQFMYESILKTAFNDPEFEFKVVTKPYTLTHQIKSYIKTSKAGTVVFFTAISYSIILTNIVSYLVNERISNLKHVQQISGMKLSAYWVGNFIFDWCKMNVTIAASIIIFYAFDTGLKSSLISYALFPFAVLPCTYCMSFIFTVDSAAQTFTMFFNFLTILVFSTMIFAFRFTRKLELFGDKLNYFMRIFPAYTLAEAVYFDQGGQILSDFRNRRATVKGTINPNPYYWKNNTGDFIIAGLHFFFWMVILVAIESDIANRFLNLLSRINSIRFPKPNKSLVIDDDVLAEAKRVENADSSQFKIRVNQLRKVYMTGKGPCNRGSPFLAVENISFGLSAGECFALLGVNGAGKSTTFKSLTSEVQPTSGSIEINGVNILKNFSSVRKFIGYCPQTNPIFDEMSVEEHLYYYGRIKGIPQNSIQELVEEAITQLDLQTHRTKPAGTLSGGNKRKLSVAMAIVGRPPIILLDEPSAGMDPEARRFMWSVVAKIASNKTSAVILTTHSMEEAEALSTKMGIMVKGGIFKCFGSAQHIRNKFGQGYIIEVKIKQPTKEDIDQITSEFVDSTSQSSKQNKDIVELVDLEHHAKKKKLPKFVLDTLIKEPCQANSEVNSVTGQVNLIQDRRHMELTQPIAERPIVDVASIDVKTKSASSSVHSHPQFQPQREEQKPMLLNDIAFQIYTQTKLCNVLIEMCREYNEVELLEQYGNHMKMRVSTKGRSLGTLFGLVESIKSKHNVSDYSISQTTLEQIFQSFANLKFDESIQRFSIDNTGELIKLEKDSSHMEKEDLEFGIQLSLSNGRESKNEEKAKSEELGEDLTRNKLMQSPDITSKKDAADLL